MSDTEDAPTSAKRATTPAEGASEDEPAAKRVAEHVKIVEGDLFEVAEAEGRGTVICHQANCVANKAAHLSADVFKRFPEADVYTMRKQGRPDDRPGTCGTFPVETGRLTDGGRPLTQPSRVVNLYGQYNPGKPRQDHDTAENRKAWFKDALGKLAGRLEGEHHWYKHIKTLVFPWGIGCGAAGGDWDAYLPMIKEFAAHDALRDKRVIIARLPKK